MKPPIALTFDDGPCEHTVRILDTLAAHNARASFFVLGGKADAGREIIKRAFAAGNEIISHSWSHRKNPNLSELPAEEIRKELTSTRDAILSITGVCPNFFRPPYGAVSDTLKTVAAELGLSIINWSVDPLDWECKNADIVFGRIMEKVHDHAIILCHDVHATTADAMERVIPALLENYRLVTVSELMRLSGITPAAGVVYDDGGNML